MSAVAEEKCLFRRDWDVCLGGKKEGGRWESASGDKEESRPATIVASPNKEEFELYSRKLP